MKDINSVTIIGRLTRDPETRQAGISTVCNFSIANNQDFGEKKHVNFIEITAWGKLGEVVEKYMKKGNSVAVEGRLNQERWEQDGNKRSKLSIIASNVQFLDTKESGSVKEMFADEEVPF